MNNDKSNKNEKQLKEYEIIMLVEKKKNFFNDVIQKTILSINKNKSLDILSITDVNTCINNLYNISEKIKGLTTITKINPLNTDLLVNNLQIINNDLSSLLKNYGTDSLEDLLSICFGSNNFLINTEDEIFKYEILKKFFHPTSYKVIKRNEKEKEKDDDKNKITIEDSMIDNLENLNCGDIAFITKKFHQKVFGLKLFIYNNNLKKNLMVYGIVDDVVIHLLENNYVNNKMKLIKENLPDDEDFHNETFSRFLISLSIKDLLVYSHFELYNKFIGYLTQNKMLKQKNLSQTVKEFIISDLFTKRTIIMQLLINSDNYENKYIAYLLYDLLSNDSNGNVDTLEQTILFDSFPWPIKQYFRDAMKTTMQYTNNLTNFDMNKIPIEQQICLMKTNDSVKEKAIIKLKEIKSKSDDSGSKARQYLEGLLKIPFEIYKKEPILCIMDEIRKKFKEFYKKYEIGNKINIPNKEFYTNIEIKLYITKIKNEINQFDFIELKKYLLLGDKQNLINNIQKINEMIENNHL